MALSENRIYLASRSPRRRELLKQIGVNFEIILMRETLPRPVDVDETPEKGESPTDYVCRITRAKAEAGWMRLVQRGLPLKPLLVADTVVAFKGNIFGKPDNPESSMAETVDELTVTYEEDGIETVKELDKEVLTKGAWSTIIFRYQDWNRSKEEYGPDKYSIRRYQKRNGQYQQKSKFNISSKDQAEKIIAALEKWIK